MKVCSFNKISRLDWGQSANPTRICTEEDQKFPTSIPEMEVGAGRQNSASRLSSLEFTGVVHFPVPDTKHFTEFLGCSLEK